MRTSRWMVVATLAALFAGADAAAEVFKCRGSDGSLSYQQMPCNVSQETVRSDIASDYPPPNRVERERVLHNEQLLYQRLEAQRERLSAEWIARTMRPEPVVIAPEAPAYGVAWVGRGYPRMHRPQSPYFR